MRTPYRIKDYNDSAKPHLRFVVNFKEDGKRARRFFGTKVEAKTFMERKTIEHKNQGREGSEFPSWLRVMAKECNDLLKPFGKSIRDAAEHYVSILRASAKSRSVSDVVAEFLESKVKKGASQRYLSDLKSRLGRFAKDFGNDLVATISTPRVEDWLNSLAVAPRTRNNTRRVLIVLFSFAEQREYATNNPVKKTTKDAEPDEEPQILTVQQTANLLAHAGPDILPTLVIGAFAGLRPSELTRLRWHDVDFGAGLIKIIGVKGSKQKGARRRFVRIQPNLAKWLAPYQGRAGSVSCSNLRKRLEATRRAAKISEWPHDGLRHGFASYSLAHFNNLNALILEMGHTGSDMIFQSYRQLVTPAEAAKYWSIKPAEADGNVIEMQSFAAV